MEASLMKKIIFDYFDGNNTSIQRKMIEEWLNNPQNKELFYQYLDEWELMHPQYIFDTEIGLKKVYQNINKPANELNHHLIKTKEINFYPYFKWLAIASVSLILIWVGWLKIHKPSLVSYRDLVKDTKNQTGEIYEKENVTSKAILIHLPDKSSIILQPKSKICYSPKQYNKTKREVILSGEAFFEVQKNSEKPFLVYSNELITKVLGTSFSIKTQQVASEIEVIVKTGKVAVFLQNDSNKREKIADNSLKGLVINANEVVKINRNDYKISKPMIVAQEHLQLPIQKLTFNFDETPVIEVIKDLEKAYNIDIVYNQEKLVNCKLTAYLSDEPLTDKLQLICIALEASYQEIDNKIILKANGCK